MVLVVPVPAIPPGLINQFPVTGKPFNTTLPVPTRQLGCVIVPTVGAEYEGRLLIVTLVPVEIQPSGFIAVTVYVPAVTNVNIPEIFV